MKLDLQPNQPTGTEQPRAFLFPPPKVINFDSVRNLWDRHKQSFDDLDNLVYCGRKNAHYSIPESIWHNPFKGENAIERFRDYLCNKRHDLLARIHELRGKTLICWCKPKPCHCDVLADLIIQQYGDGIRGWLELRRTVDPRDQVVCIHCQSPDVRLMHLSSYEVVDYRGAHPRRWFESEMVVGCMKCLRRTVITKTKSHDKKKLPVQSSMFWHTRRGD
jgi:hypothetical protein